MERESPGVVNAYILNLMTHSDRLIMDEYFNQGFEFVSAIGPDRAIMRLP